MSDRDPRPDSPADDDRLDGMLRDAFGPRSSITHAEDLIDKLDQRGRVWARILLRELDEEQRVHPPSATRELLFGDDLAGRYQVFGEIARGGIGLVMRGRDRILGRDVAIKALREDRRGDPATDERFFEEAQIGAQLQHPGIVPVHEVGLVDGEHPFFTMKLVHGQTLAEILRDRSEIGRSRPQLIDLFLQVCQALAYAHSRGVIHRDLKPSNIMVGRYGEVQVMDWGLCKVLPRGGVADDRLVGRQPAVNESLPVETVRSDEAGSQSQMGSVFGTPAYMAPEQARGQIDRLDERTDVFALGAILCEILTGSPPYSATQDFVLAQARAAATGDALARLAECDADEALIALARRCLEVEPANRPRNASALAEELRRYLDELEQRARSAEAEAEIARVRTQAAKRSQRLTLALAASLLVLSALGIGTWLWRQRVETDRLAEVEQRVDETLRAADVLVARGAAQDPRRATDLYKEALRQSAVAAREAEAGSDRMRARARGVNARIREELAATVSAAETLAFQERLQRDLRDLRMPMDLGVGTASEFAQEHGVDLDWALRQDEGHREVFASHGIDVDRVEVAAVVDALRGGQAQSFAGAFDYWALQRRHLACNGYVTFESLDPLLEIATALDASNDRQNQIRQQLRLPEFATETEALINEVRGIDPREELPMTLVIFAQLLGEQARAAKIELLARSQAAHPDSYLIHVHAGLAHENQPEPDIPSARACYLAALALEPDAVGPPLRLALLANRNQAGHEISLWAQRALDVRPDNVVALNMYAGGAIVAGRLQVARTHLQRAVALQPDLAPTHYNLARLVEAEGGTADQVIAYCTRAVELDPDLVPPQLFLGVMHGRLKQPFRAAHHLRTAIRLGHRSPTVYRSLAVHSRKIGDLEGAAEAYRGAIEVDPNYAPGYNGLGVILGELGELDLARRQFEKAISIDPELDIAVNNLGSFMVRSGRLDRARQLYEREVELAPKSPSGYDYLGLVDVLEGDDSAASRRFDQVDRRWSTRYRGRHYLAALAVLAATARESDRWRYPPEIRQRLHDRAIDWLRARLRWLRKRAEALDPRGARLALQEGRYLAGWSRFRSVRDSVELAALPTELKESWQQLWADLDSLMAEASSRLDEPRTPAELLDRASHLQQAGEPLAAKEILEHVLFLEPASVEARTGLCVTLLDLRLYRESLSYADQALAMDPERPECWLARAHSLFELGRHAEALAAYRKCIELGEDDCIIHANLATTLAFGLLERERDPAKGLEHARIAVQMDPESRRAQLSLGPLLFANGEYRQAIDVLRQDVKRRDAKASSWLFFGLSHARIGRSIEAANILGRVGDRFEVLRQSEPYFDELIDEAKVILDR